MRNSFIKYNFMIIESKLYDTIVDYEMLFKEISDEDHTLLSRLTLYYYKYFIDNTYFSIAIEPIKKIDGIPIRIHFYINRNIYDYRTEEISTKIGVNVSMPPYEYVNVENSEILQNINLLGCDLNNEKIFKNYIYNVLFYTQIIIRDFKFHPILSYLNHKDDIENLLEIKGSIIKLFGENIDCCVCLEKTITKTICDHGLCQSCYSNLVTKSCPLCRSILLNEDIDDEDIY